MNEYMNLKKREKETEPAGNRTDSLRGISLYDCRSWLAKSKLPKAGCQEGRLELSGTG